MKNMLVDKNIGSSTFTEMKIVNISEKYTISFLKNTENKVYFIHNILDPQNRNCRNEANFEPNKSFVKKFKCGKLFKSLLNIIKHKHLHNFDLG